MNDNDKIIEIKKIRCIDGLYYSFEILEHFYKDLHHICSSLLKSKENVSKALTHSWGFIDTVHRIREISKSTPGINQKSPEMRIFLDTTKVTQEFRNYIQHLNNELKKNSPNKFPVWGSLSWVDPQFKNKCHTAIFGTIIHQEKFSSCIYDRINDHWVSKVTLTINNNSFNFDPIYESVQRLKDFILHQIENGLTTEIKFFDTLPIITTEIKIESN